MRAFLVITVAAVVFAQRTIDPTERLVVARQIFANRNKRLPDYTCLQTVERRYFTRRHAASPAPSCDQIRSLNPSGLVLQSTDRLRLEVKVSEGHEIGSWPGSRFTSGDIFELIGGGAYGTGTMGGLVSDILANGGGRYTYIGEDMASATGFSVYRYRIPLGFSHYQIKAGSKWTVNAVDGIFWLDSNTLDLNRILVEAHDPMPATGECEAATTVNYQKVKVGAGEFLLPERSSMKILMRDESEVDVTAVYSGCREYRGEATIHFNEAPVGGAEKAADISAAPLVAGIPLTLALTEPIDTDTAAAGDIVRAKVLKPAHDPLSKAVLVPAGATVQGRILQIQHWLSSPRHFNISIQLENLQLDGVLRPLYAKVIPSISKGIFLSPLGQSPLVAAFPFQTDKGRYRVPAGYESKWVTVDSPQNEKEERH